MESVFFVRHLGELISVSEIGQLAMREIITIYLQRIERDEAGLPIKWYPFTREEIKDGTRLIVIDPVLSFGRPVISGAGVSIAAIVSRYRAGESIDELMDDFHVNKDQVQEAIRCELNLRSAA